MKTTLITMLFGLLLSGSASAVTYQTIANGNWNDPAIWSTDGGFTSCGCIPPNPIPGDDVYIYHDVTMTQNVGMYLGTYFYLDAAGSLTGPSYNLLPWGLGTTVDLYGPVVVNKLKNAFSGAVFGADVNIYNTFEAGGRIELYAGTVNVNGGYLYMPSGNFDNYANSTFNILAGAKLELFGGNITNEGTMFICDICCAETVGNWKNEATGTVSGSGSAQTSGGNMTNLGSFSTSITWCSAGFDAGMPSTEDCTTSNTTCGAVALPVVLASFSGVNRGDYNEIVWVTSTERDCDYFVLNRSEDGVNWYAITTVPGAGNSDEETIYTVSDEGINDTYYYQLEQYDINGDRKKSYPISVAYTMVSEDLLIYPNPSSRGDLIHVAGLQSGGEIQVYSATGAMMLSQSMQTTGHFAELNTEQLSPGIYTLIFTDKTGESKRAKFAVR